MVRKKLIIIFLFINGYTFSQTSLSTNNTNKAHRRYWYYRTRLINDFIKIGKDQGDCNVIAERNYFEDNDNVNSARVGPDQIDISNQYISALALEYKLLSRANQSTRETIKELYYLLYSYNRLDAEAEFLWSNPPTQTLQPSGNLNGFILRQDYPQAYIGSGVNQQNFNHFNYAVNEYAFDTTNVSQSYVGLTKINNLSHGNNFNDFVHQPSYSNKRDCFLVQDKYMSMLAAFMFIVKYIPNNTIYFENGVAQSFQDGVYGIKEEAVHFTNRLIQYIKGNTFANIPTNDWVIKMPDGSDIGYFSGSGLTAFSFPAHRMICEINHGYPWFATDDCSYYADPVEAVAGWLSYGILSTIPGATQDNGVEIAWYQAGSNYPSPPPPPAPQIPVISCNIAMMANTAWWHLEWAELMRRVLYQTGHLMRQESVYADPINQAPCIGPYNYGECNYASWEWSSQDRLEHPNARGKGCGTINGPFVGNYPGVDYMLLHNLFFEYLNQEDDASSGGVQGAYKNAYNLMDNYDEQIWPQETCFSSGLGVGHGNSNCFLIGVNNQTLILAPPSSTYEIPAQIKVFQNLESRAQIYASSSPLAPNNALPSKVEYRAGKDITLLPEQGGQPGFEVRYGSDFVAYIQRYVCTQGDYGNGLRQNPNTANQYSNDYENDDMNTIVPIHHVDYPKSDSDLNPLSNDNEPIEAMSVSNEQTQLQQIMVDQQNASKGIYNSNKNLDQRFLVMPNPNNGLFSIYANRIADDEVLTINIIDMKGQEIMRFDNLTDNVKEAVDLTNYAKGIYLIKLNSNKGFSSMKKINVD